MQATDLLNLERVNMMDPFVTTYGIGFYLEYLAKWPQYCHIITSRSGVIEGYSTFSPHFHQDLHFDVLLMTE